MENDAVFPLNVYGYSKALSEQLVLKVNPAALIIRTSAFFGPLDIHNFVHGALQSFKNQQSFTAVSNIFVSPTYVPDLVNNSLDLMLDNAAGVWHLANAGEISWASFAEEVARRGGYQTSLINQVSFEELNWPAKRPQYSALKSEKGMTLPSLNNALDRFFNEQKLINI